MTTNRPKNKELATQGRNAALIMVATTLLWLGAQALGGRLGWDIRLAVLIDILALVGFSVALWITYRVLRQRRAERD